MLFQAIALFTFFVAAQVVSVRALANRLTGVTAEGADYGTYSDIVGTAA